MQRTTGSFQRGRGSRGANGSRASSQVVEARAPRWLTGRSGLRTSTGGAGMNISAPFIRRPVATTLLTIAIALAGAIAYQQLPVAPLPQVDFPTISVSGESAGGQRSNHGLLRSRLPWSGSLPTLPASRR